MSIFSGLYALVQWLKLLPEQFVIIVVVKLIRR
jgi:hypothetical protein